MAVGPRSTKIVVDDGPLDGGIAPCPPRDGPAMTPEINPVDDIPSPDEIRATVDRMIVSDAFSRSPQLGAFLRFVVESVLQGKSDRIKGYTIGVEVLRRDPSFDPQSDPIVRVEATRLRRTIERYYAGPGADDPVIVDLPRGSYVPTFRHRQVGGPQPACGLGCRRGCQRCRAVGWLWRRSQSSCSPHSAPR